MKLFFLIIVLFSSLDVYATEPSRLYDEDSDFAFTPGEASSFVSTGFRISGGAIQVNALGGWADGEYLLREVNIAPTDIPNTFVADLVFTKKKGSLSFLHREKIGILYDGVRLWIKYRKRIHRYSVPSPIQNITKDHNGINIQTKPPTLDTALENMTLRFEF